MLMKRILVVLSALLLAQAEKTGLRNNNQRNLVQSFECILYEVATEFEDHHSIFEHICEGKGDDGDFDMMYNIDDNNGVISHKLDEGGLDILRNSGRYKITLTNVIIDKEPVVTTTPSSVVTIEDLYEQTGRRLDRKVGPRSMVIIRVTAADANPVKSSSQIADSFFGTAGDPNNLKSRFEVCSMGQLVFSPGVGTPFVNGVAELTVSVNIQGQNVHDVVNTVTNTLTSTYGSSFRNTYSHVVYALPPGTLFNAGGSPNWLAFAYMNSYLSVYNSNNIVYISNQVHETGHNLGLMHSSHGGVTYGDQSGTMGYGYGKEDFPQMCFNAAKSWQLGWYEDKAADINPASSGTFTGYLDSFVDYKNVPANEYALIKVKDYHIIYNRAKGINSETQEFANMVTISEMKSEADYSHAITAMNAGNSFTGNGVTIEVCQFDSVGSVDRARISIYTQGTASGCSGAPTPASPVATPSPTPPPVVAATPPPTLQTPPPTPPPSPSPVADPTYLPTPEPTPRPSPSPTTAAPITVGPTYQPTPGPTPFPTASPTPGPTPRPIEAPVTPAPTHEACDPDTMEIKITIKTDSKPAENSWYLKIRSGYPVDSVSSLTLPFHEYKYRYCVAKDLIYEFRLSDSGGDGISSVANGEGYYTVTVDGEVYSSGGDFGSDEVDYIQGPCQSDSDDLLQFVLMTGTSPEKISWTLTKQSSATQISGGGPWTSHAGRSISYVAHECLAKNECYTYTLNSSDGSGLNNGNLELNWANANVGFTAFASGSTQSYNFGNC